MSIVQRLAKLLGHPIGVRSALGKGSTFSILLPIAAAQQPEVIEDVPAQDKARRQTGTILMVEDEEDLRNLMGKLLEDEGHTVVAMPNAQDALTWASTAPAPPDLLLTDFELHTGPSGLSLAQELPDVLGFAVPTIILTGHITAETMQSIAEASFEQIAKPVSPEVLLPRISVLMHAARAAIPRKQSGSVVADERALHIVDDDPMIRATTRRLFETEGWPVYTYKSAEAFLAAPRPGPAACLIVDGVLPGMSGVALLEALQAEKSTLPAVMLTGHGDAAMAVKALKAGAADLIEKPARAVDLLASVNHAIERSIDERARNTARRAAQKSFDGLTPRERDVLVKVLDGTPNKIIAADLGINQRTVENHRASVMRKTGTKSLPELVRLALAAGPLLA
ncbi:MAG: response regulator [Gemmobacter sp.]|nr:response regulator [Gemmobacter sp.]